MNIVYRPIDHGANSNKPRRIVVHAMGEYIKYKGQVVFAPDFLDMIGLSAHALMVPNGDVMVCREDSQGAWHAKGFNDDSLGVEFLVPGVHDYGSFLDTIKTDYVVPEQYESGIQFVRRWVTKYNISDIDRHSDLDPDRKADPGEGFDWDDFLYQVSASRPGGD